MRREQRLTRSCDFKMVLRRGKTQVHSLMVLKALPNRLGRNRYGFIVSKKVGKAVVRNLVRRRMRESARATPAKPGWDLVFIASNGASTARYREIKAEIEWLLKRARLLEEWR